MRDVVSVSTSKEINQFIVDNHKEMSQQEIADHFGVTCKSINCRVSRLRKKNVIPSHKATDKDISKSLVSLDKAYDYSKGRNKKEPTKEEIQKYILENYKKYTNEKIAEDLGVPIRKVAGNVVGLIRKGLLVSDNSKPKKKAKLSDTGNTYSNANGENKQKARERMEVSVTTSGVTGTVLTLPHIECKIEKMILAKDSSFNFIGCEIDKPTFKAMNKTIKKENLPIESHLGMISDKIYGADSNTYAHMILDYCGSIVSFDKELRYTIQNNLVKVGGTISVTFNKRGHYNPDNIIKNLANTVKNYEDLRGEMDRGIEAYFHKLVGFDYTITEIFNYKDKGKSPMVLVRIKRVQ